MENQSKNCEKLIERWRELKTKLPRVQRIVPGKSFEPSYISPEEMDELDEIEKNIEKQCLDSEFLTSDEKYRIKY